MSSGTLINQIDQISSNLNDCYGPVTVIQKLCLIYSHIMTRPDFGDRQKCQDDKIVAQALKKWAGWVALTLKPRPKLTLRS